MPNDWQIYPSEGFVRTFDLQTSPLRQKALITYALSEDMKGRLVRLSDRKNPYCAPFVSDKENYTHWSRYKEGAKLEDWEKVGVWVVGLPSAETVT